MSNPVYLRLIILQLSKIIMYEFWYSYVKTKNGEKVKLCFIVYIKTDDICKDIPENLETSLELDRPLPIGKNKKAIGLMKDDFLEESYKKLLD